MSRKFLQDTALYPYEAMMQQTPRGRPDCDDRRREMMRYYHMLSKFVKENALEAIKDQIVYAMPECKIDIIVFKDEFHKFRFCKYKRKISAQTNTLISVIYLLSSNIVFNKLLNEMANNNEFIVPEDFQAVEKELCSICRFARNLQIKAMIGNVEELNKIHDSRALLLAANALMLKKYGYPII